MFVYCAQVSSNIYNNSLVPCLGLSWANLVTTKIQLHYDFGNIRFPNEGQKSSRIFRVASAPHLPPNSISYEVTEAGISGK